MPDQLRADFLSCYGALFVRTPYIDGLAEQGVRTVILFSSDHGDCLGDHGLVGKNSFHEAATRVPLLVRLPGAAGTTSYSGLVSLSDVTGTVLCLAGCPSPAHMDSAVLLGLGLADKGRVGRSLAACGVAGCWSEANGS